MNMPEQNIEEGIIKPWGDPALREPDLKPGEGSRQYAQDKLEKERGKRKPKTASSRVPWNTHMVKPIDSKGNYREVDPATGNIIRGDNPSLKRS